MYGRLQDCGQFGVSWDRRRNLDRAYHIAGAAVRGIIDARSVQKNKLVLNIRLANLVPVGS